MVELDDGVGWDHETDVVVIGCGGAGGCTAISAARAGAEVLVLEKQPEETYYSNTRMSGGAFHSPEPDADRAALREYALAMFSGDNLEWKLEGELPVEIAEDLAETWAKYAPENDEWMCELDPDFEVVYWGGAAFPQFPGAADSGYRVAHSTYSGTIENRNRCQRDDPKSEKESGEAFYHCLRSGMEAEGVSIHWGTAGTEFVVDENGAVCGVVAERDGESVTYRADATVLTTGGFEYDTSLRLNFLEGPGVEGWAFYGSPANTGDGIYMAMELGAGLSKVSKSASRMITAIPERRHGLKIGLRTPAIGRPHAIVVDNYGHRYAAERTITRDPERYFFYKEGVRFDIEELLYPRIPSWMIFDETLRLSRSVVGLGEIGYHDLEWGERNEAAIEQGWILQGDTIDELAEAIRGHPENRELLNPSDLAETISSYNHACEMDEDRAFPKNDPENMGPIASPPFYAIPLYPGGPNTKGGIMTDGERRVLDTDGKPIPNLYSVGEISSAFKFVYQGGGNLAECIVFGRLAGRNAAAQA